MDELRPLIWVGSSKRDLLDLPEEVRWIFGFALYQAQIGQKHVDAKPLKGFGGAGVLEVVEDHQGDTYRAVYTVRFEDEVYVLHAFQKKAKSGIKTPQKDMDLIAKRLADAARIHKDRLDERNRKETGR